MTGLMKHLYIVRNAGPGKIFCNFSKNPVVLIFLLAYFLNVCQMLRYYPTLILNVFAMMSEKHCYC